MVEDMWAGAGNAIGSALESALPKSKTQVDLESGKITQEGQPDLAIEENESGPANAEYVSYLSVSTFELPEGLSALAGRFGNATVETVRYHGDRNYSSAGEAGILIEHDNERFVYLNHEADNYWAMTYEELFQFAGAAMDKLRTQMGQIAPPPEYGAEMPEIEVDVNVYAGVGGSRRGLTAKHNIVVVEATMENPESGESGGKVWVVMELWSAESYAGSGTIQAFDQRVGESIVSAMGGSTLNAKMDFSAFGDPRLLEGLQEAQEKLDDVSGLPVELNTYFVMTGENAELNHLQVIGGGQSDQFSVLFTTQSFISNLSTAPFDESLVGIPETYQEIAFPYAGLVGSGGN